MSTRALFLSDFHLGAPNNDQSRAREVRICNLLDSFYHTTDVLYLVGDIFDFWFEYHYVAPIGYYRFFSRLIQWSEAGKKIHLYVGNHDMWIFGKWASELGVEVHYAPEIITIDNTRIYVGHGDGLGPGDMRYKLLKKFFRSKLCKFLFHWLHPDVGIGIASYLSKRSRISTGNQDDKYYGHHHEYLYQYSKSKIEEGLNIDYFVFGHRHLPLYIRIENSNSIYVNLGDWIKYDTYAYFESGKLSLIQHKTSNSNEFFSK